MNLKERLEIVRLKNKYEAFRGIKGVRISSIDDLTEKEESALGYSYKDSSIADAKIILDANYAKYLLWSKNKIKPFINDNMEVIIIDGYNLAYVIIENTDIFLEDFFENRKSFSISLINRDMHKCIVIYKTEYYLEFFETNI